MHCFPEFAEAPCVIENFISYLAGLLNSIISENLNSSSLSKCFVLKFSPAGRLYLATFKWFRTVFLTGVRIFPKGTYSLGWSPDVHLRWLKWKVLIFLLGMTFRVQNEVLAKKACWHGNTKYNLIQQILILT